MAALGEREQTDEALMARAQAGDSDAFAQLYDRHSERALRIALAVCHDQSRAEDAVKEGFLAIWHSRAGYRPDAGSFQIWAMRILKDSAIAGSEGLIASLRRLPEAQAEVIVLAYFGELSHSKIAALLELPPGTVKGRMRLGLEKLRREMEVAAADDPSSSHG